MSEPSGLWAFLGVTGVGSLVLAQPVYDVLARSPEYFVVRRSTPLAVILLGLGLLLPGLFAGVLAWLAGVGSVRRRRVAVGGALAIFAGLLVLQICLRFEIGTIASYLAAATAAGLSGVLFARIAGYRWFASALGFAPAVFLTVFLVQMPLAELSAPIPDTLGTTQLQNTVVFVIFDEFPTVSLLDSSGAIDSSRFPNFARLADMSTWYRNAVTVHSHTPYAVPAILTGTYPNGRVPHYAAYPQNLFTLTGSEQAVIHEPFTHLCPPPLCAEESKPSAIGLPEVAFGLWRRLTLGAPDGEEESFADPFDELAFAAGTADSDELLARVNVATQSGPSGQFQAFVGEVRPNTLNFLHVLLPHAPFRYYPDGTQYNDFETLQGAERGEWLRDPAGPLLARQRHLLQVMHTDTLLGTLVDRLDSEGWLDDALIVVVADHGAAFEPGKPSRGLTPETIGEIGLVPLFIKTPGQTEGFADSRPVLTVDVLPTVADALDLPVTSTFDGSSLLDSEYTGAPQRVEDHGGNLPFPDAGAALMRIAKLRSAAFPLPGPEGLFAMAPYEDWIGKDLDSIIPITSEPGPGASLLTEDLLQHVSRESGFVPGLIRGGIEGEVASGSSVAIVENGLVLAVAPVIADSAGELGYSAVLDPSRLADGPHSLELYLVAPDGKWAAPLGYTGPELLALDADARLLSTVSRDYEILEQGEGRRGYVESVGWNPLHVNTQSMYLIGWAVDDNESRGADRIVAFVDGEFAGSAIPDIDLRGQVAGLPDSDIADNGFTLSIPYLVEGTPVELRTFALWDGVALELPMVDQVVASLQESTRAES